MFKTKPHHRVLADLLRPHLGILITALACTAAAGGLLLLVPSWIRTLAQEVLPANDLARLTRHLLWGLALILAIQALLFTKDFIRLRVSHQAGAGIRGQLFERILMMPLDRLPGHRSGDLVSRLSNDVLVFQDGLMKGLFRLVPNLLLLIALVAWMFAQSPALSAITLLFIGPMGFTIHYFVKKIRRRVKESQESLAQINNLAEETIRGLREIKAFGQEDQVAGTFGIDNRLSLHAYIRQDWVTALNPVIVLLVTVAGVGGLVYLCAWMVHTGHLSLGDLIAFLTCLGLVYSPLQEVTGSFSYTGRIYAVMDRFEEILSLPKEPLDQEIGPGLTGVSGAIRFKDVHFAYPGDGGFSLKNINLDIRAGETVAFVGPSGAGKSTLLSLVPLFLVPGSGSIEIDGKDIREAGLKDLRRLIGLVAQEPVLFNGTLLENIAFSRPGAGEEDVLSAARAAHVEEFALKLPREYHTHVGQYGCKLSVGQRQRIAIARALLADPSILILDEPTSALDTESEYLVRDSLKKLCKGKTTLIVAHRMSTVRSAHRIVVLEDGRIVETGTHEELLQKQGLYRKLFAYQDFY